MTVTGFRVVPVPTTDSKQPNGTKVKPTTKQASYQTVYFLVLLRLAASGNSEKPIGVAGYTTHFAAHRLLTASPKTVTCVRGLNGEPASD